jgi:hypothetical protein
MMQAGFWCLNEDVLSEFRKVSWGVFTSQFGEKAFHRNQSLGARQDSALV